MKLSEEHLCRSGQTFSEDEVRRALRDELGDEDGCLTDWAARHRVSARHAALFLLTACGPTAEIARAIGFEPVTVYRPLTEAGRRALKGNCGNG